MKNMNEIITMNTMKNGQLAWIKDYKNKSDVTVEFEDGKRFEVPCMCLKVVEPTISGKCRVIEPTPINIDDIVDLELNDFSDISISEEFYAYGIILIRVN